MPIERCVYDRDGGKRIARFAGPELAELAGRQHGVVARRQLLALGLSAREIDGRIARRHLLRLHYGVYAVGHRALSRDGHLLAAVLACGPGAVLSRRSAGELWGIVPRRDVDPEVTRPSACRRSGITTIRGSVPGDERRLFEGIPLTSPPRTMLDLAAVLTERQLERAFHEMEVRRLTDRLSIPALIERYPGRRGTMALRRILHSRKPAGITQNEFEEAFVALLDAHGLQRGRMNASLWIRGRFYEPDCLWEDRHLMVELDGREVHATDRSFESDRKRDRVLLAEGWRTMRITWRQLRDEPAAVAADLRGLLEQGALGEHEPRPNRGGRLSR